jgi:hypothetical protein
VGVSDHRLGLEALTIEERDDVTRLGSKHLDQVVAVVRGEAEWSECQARLEESNAHGQEPTDQKNLK